MKIKKSKSDIALDVFIYLFFASVIIATLYPFLNILAVSFNDATDTVRGANFIIPRKFTLANYANVFTFPNLLHSFFVSVARTVLGTIIGVLSAAMLAFTLSRKNYVFRNFISTFFVITMYVSGGLIPTYMLFRSLHLLNSFWVYIIPAIISTWNVIVIRSFMDGLPYSLQESAMIEGANDFVIFTKVVLPLCKPVLATVALFVAVGQWNSWFDTYLYNNASPELSTLQYELMKVMQSTTASTALSLSHANANAVTSNLGLMSAQATRATITMIVIIPILLVYPYLQKYFVSGLTIGAVKN